MVGFPGNRLVIDAMQLQAPAQHTDQPRVVMVQDGARRHYAVPLAMQRTGVLELMYTEWYAGQDSLATRLANLLSLSKPNIGRRAEQRWCPEIPSAKVRSNPWLVLRHALFRKLFKSPIRLHRWRSDTIGRWIVRSGFGDANIVYGFVRHASVQLMAAAKAKGLITIGDQMIAPAAEERRQAMRQAAIWPGWEQDRPWADYDLLVEIEQQTWKHTDRIVCGSSYVRDALVAQGVDLSRIVVLPTPVMIDLNAMPQRERHSGAITVGFVGHVCVRKGAPWFFEVARHFDPRHVKFVMVGPVALNRDIADKHRGHVELVGGVDRKSVAEWLERFDIFFFPTTCEGSAMAVIEAMAAGLPVVTSPNSGTYALDGEECFLVPFDDVAKAVERIGQLADDHALRTDMGLAAWRRVMSLRVDQYAHDLAHCLKASLGDARVATKLN